MKGETVGVIVFVSLMVAGVFWAGFLTANKITKASCVTANVTDCQKRGGEYALSIQPDGSIFYETCEVNNRFDYKRNKPTAVR